MRSARLTGWGWAGLGLAGSSALTLAGPDLIGGKPISWWFNLHLPAGRTALFYAGMAALCVAWLGVGRRRRKPSELVLIGAIWCIPLLAGPPLFSHDVYSYLAQGEVLHLGLNPYHHGPEILARFGQNRLLAGVSPIWRTTTSPYGPLFLALASLTVGVVGSNLIAGVLVMRLIELAGLVLLAVFTPRLARSLGTDPGRAIWMAVISPLVLLELIAAGHNDALMVGLLVAGVTLAIERRPLLGIALCSIAAMVKLPAFAAVVFIAVAWARDEWAPPTRPPTRPPARGAGQARGGTAARALALSVAVAVAVLAAVSVATGLGLSWVSGGVLSTPGKVHLAITPVTAAGWSLASLLHDLGLSASYRGIESGLGAVTLGLTAVLALALLRQVRYGTMALALGVLLLVSVFAGPATWPWYLTWGLALVACCPVTERARAVPVLLVLSVFLVKPNGILALPLQRAPFVLAAYLIAVALIWRSRRGRGGALLGRVRSLTGGEPTALTNASR